MTTTFKRRVLRGQATANDLMARSKWMIWCFDPESVPAMIDLLIAQGRLSEADRPHCVHWWSRASSQRSPGQEVALTIDAEEMLELAGIRTRFAGAWDALTQGVEAFRAYVRDRYGEEFSAEEIGPYQEMHQRMQRWRQISAPVASSDLRTQP